MQQAGLLYTDIVQSPSMRREWIEIGLLYGASAGLQGLPPCGGSGLKLHPAIAAASADVSPSMRREWIEIHVHPYPYRGTLVSLHAEGVD